MNIKDGEERRVWQFVLRRRRYDVEVAARMTSRSSFITRLAIIVCMSLQYVVPDLRKLWWITLRLDHCVDCLRLVS